MENLVHEMLWRGCVRLRFESGCDNPSERVNHQYCAQDLKIGPDSLSTFTHAEGKSIHFVLMALNGTFVTYKLLQLECRFLHL